MAALEIYGAPFGAIDFFLLRAMFVGFILALSFICYTYSFDAKSDKVPVVDIVMAVLGFSVGVYIVCNGDAIVNRWTGVDPLSATDIFFTSVLFRWCWKRHGEPLALSWSDLVFRGLQFCGKIPSRGFWAPGNDNRWLFRPDGLYF